MGVVSRSVAYRAGFKISDVRVDAVAPVCPILLVHGSEDSFVALKHSQKLQQAFKHTATLRVDDGGKHDSRRARSVWKSNSGAPRLFPWPCRLDGAEQPNSLVDFHTGGR